MTLGAVLRTSQCEVLVINLDRRPDRWERISTHLRDHHISNFQRIQAIDGLKQSIISLTDHQKRVWGCLKSHLKALHIAAQVLKTAHKVLILEDDCIFIESAGAVLKKSLDELPPGWKVLMLGCVYGRAPGFISSKDHLVRVYNSTGAHAYMVNASSCAVLIERIKRLLSQNVIKPVDQLYCKYQSIEVWYATNPLVAGQRSGDFSDIENRVRVHTASCFKLGVTINWKIWLWMTIRSYLRNFW